MKANMHIHSVFSDGTDFPEEIVKRAKKNGIELISLTDHDSMQGIPIFLNACKNNNIIGIPGVEIDCKEKIQINNNTFIFDMELLAYYPNHIENNKLHETMLFKFLEKRRASRNDQMKKYLIKAQDLFKNKSINYEMLLRSKLNEKYNINHTTLEFSWLRSELYDMLIKNKILTIEKLIKDAEKNSASTDLANNSPYKYFKKTYFTKERLGEDSSNKPSLTELIDLINNDGGYSVLPHIGHMYNDDINAIKLKNDEINNFIQWCKNKGLWGIELYYYNNKPESTDIINKYIKEIADKYKFKYTYGSDYHGRNGYDNLENYINDFKGFK